MINNYGNFLGNTWIYLTTVLPCFFPIRFLIDTYLIVVNCTLIMLNDELLSERLPERLIRDVFLPVSSHKY